MDNIVYILLVFVLHLSSAAVVIPLPNGRYGVGTTEAELVDTPRLDQLAPNPTNRSVVVSAFYPIAAQDQCHWDLVSYMPSKTAAYADQDVADLGVPKGTFGSFRLQMCSLKHPHHSKPKSSLEQYPLVLFSPASGASRLYYSVMAQTVASYGYTVVTIDHPYEAHIVEFPDGRVVKGTISEPGWPLIKKLLEIRAEDVSFVIDELTKPEVFRPLLPHLDPNCRPSTGRVAIYGHSAGGATALLSMVNESRIIGGINLDGGLSGAEKSVVEIGLQAPFMFFQSDGWDSEGWTERPWKHVWPHLDWKLWLLLKGSKHETFTDVPLLAHLLGLNPKKIPGAGKVIGTIPGDRAMEIISTHVVTFMDFVFKSKPQQLLQSLSEAFPEISFIRS